MLLSTIKNGAGEGLWYYSFITVTKLMWHYIGTCTFSVFFYRQHIYIQAHSTDSVKNRQNGGTHDHLTAVCEYPAGPEVDDDLYGPSLYLQKWQWLVWKLRGRPRRLCSSLVALFAHQWSSSGTRFRGEAHLQYKNIVQQFSCHSKHSYLSFNGPVTPAAIQKK